MGTAALGFLYQPIDTDTAVAAVQKAYDLGIRYFDTAPLYGEGTAERRLGAALQALPRDQVVVSTKVGYTLLPQGGVDHDYRKDTVQRSLEESLVRLQVEQVDLVFIHDPDDHYAEAMDEAYPVLHRLRESGVIRAIGVGMNQSAMLTQFAHDGDFDCFLLAGRYTLLDQSATADLLPVAAAKGIHLVIGGPFNSGILTDPWAEVPMFNYEPAPEAWVQRARALDALCSDFQVPLKAAALQFPSAHPAVASVLTGARTAAELAENAQALSHPIPSAFWSALRDSGLLMADVPLPGQP
jgi:D-threo-aldose 1-dehydrogenase